MNRPMQTPKQGLFGDSCAVLASVMRDATKYLVSRADVIPGLAAAMMTTASSAERGMLNTDVSVAGASETAIFYGVFIQLPINAVIGRQNLGDFASKQATVERVGRIVVRSATFQTVAGGQVTISPFDTGVAPGIADVGKSVHAVRVQETGIPGSPFILKWRVKAGGGTAFDGFADVGSITAVSDDSSEVEIDIPGGRVEATTFND